MKNDSGIYSKRSKGTIYSPFNLHIDPMKRLAFIDIKKDRDEIYVGFELQVLYDHNYIERILVRAERHDGYYDLYHQPGLSYNAQSDIMSERVIDIIERQMENAKYEVTSKGVDVYFSFLDKTGRQIEGILIEDNQKRSSPFSILAPVGGVFAKPPVLPIYLLFDMYFPPKKKTIAKIRIDKKIHQPDTFPLPLDWEICYFCRYSTDTFIVNWNKNLQGNLSPLNTEGRLEIQESDNITYNLVDNNGHSEIKSISAGNSTHQLKIHFSPAIPDIICLNDGVITTGTILISSDKSVGSISGEYEIQRTRNKIFLKVHPISGWKPNESKWALRFLYRFDPLFKKWPSTYIWTGRIELDGDKEPVIDSRWERTDKWQQTLKSQFSKLASITN